ncbi:LysR family transcriptional regulator ArgP [Luteipulveratus flavus]|uniref:LysR family transcriptional regulator ArgP n=1 Tax=Luteipulveratus flavus TaxID=3031728 RepID=A0ABT6C9C3_9MICO|nr:LysR family transcriptional regulator ArgP [Luteipulveratus sp. YIM 133296]MDF8265500.1 LysR family transcriptional regulator ArgP [Luteipulveratus sp. YIM 133296]
MTYNGDQLEALLAIVDHGTFDAAARHLSITPSAVSQRIRALEAQVGQVVVRRTTPCTATEAGAVLLRLARQRRLLDDAAAGELCGDASGAAGVVELSVAVNADSLATWFTAVLDACADSPEVLLRLHVEDQAHSAELLRTGTVLGAVTSDPVAVQGCSVEPLGVMRYRPAASPALLERYSTGRGPRWSAMPVVRFNTKDDLQHDVLSRHGVVADPPTHLVPSSHGFLAAVRAGLGWGAVPDLQAGDDYDTGRLVRLGARDHVDVPLYWQRWRLRSDRLDDLTVVVRAAARSALRHP